MKDCTECKPEFLCEEHFKLRGGLPQPKEIKKQSKVSICDQGHKHIPFKGTCQFCLATSPRFQTTEVEESTFTKPRYIEL